jgi:hypothetical protein
VVALTHASRNIVLVLSLLAVAATTTPVVAQTKINIDFTSLAGWPDHPEYGAAGTPGWWNETNLLLNYPASAELFSVDGEFTGVEIELPSGPVEIWEGSYSAKESPFTGDDRRVLADGMFNADVIGGVRLTGLENGTYRVLTYGIQPDPSPLWGTTFWVNDSENQRISGAWTGEFEEGVTHATFVVAVTDGTIRVSWVNGIWFGFFSALQIEQLQCPNFDEDGSVGFNDLQVLLQTWGPCEGCPTDLTGSGSVGFEDLLILLNAWGPCP